MDKFFLSLKRFRFYSFWFCTNLRKKYRDIFSGKKNIFFLLEIICRRKLSAEVLGRRKKFFFSEKMSDIFLECREPETVAISFFVHLTV